MNNIRALAEKDLSQTIEAEFAIPVVLISPAGQRITETINGKPLVGRVLWERKEINPDTGEPVIVPSPTVTLRESSLPVVPKTGEQWYVQIPSGPRPDSPMTHYLTDINAAVELGRSLGVINLPLVLAIDEPGNEP
jgi:hypothetical protein